MRAEWLDGAGLVAWLEARGHDNWSAHGEGTARAIGRWKNEGSTASIWAADRVLTDLGHHLSELPDSLWVRGRVGNRHGVSLTPNVKAELLREYGEGVSAKELSARYGPAAETIRKWASQAKIRRKQAA